MSFTAFFIEIFIPNMYYVTPVPMCHLEDSSIATSFTISNQSKTIETHGHWSLLTSDISLLTMGWNLWTCILVFGFRPPRHQKNVLKQNVPRKKKYPLLWNVLMTIFIS